MTDKFYDNEQPDIVNLVDEDGNEYEYEIIASIEDGGNIYFALVPYNDEVIEEYLVLKGVATESGDPDAFKDLVYIESEEEFNRVAAIFDEIINEDVENK